MAASNQKPSRSKNSNFTVLDSNVKLRSFQKIKKWNQKLNSDLFNYSCLHLVFILFNNLFYKNTRGSVLHSNMKLQAESKASEENAVSLYITLTTI